MFNDLTGGESFIDLANTAKIKVIETGEEFFQSKMGLNDRSSVFIKYILNAANRNNDSLLFWVANLTKSSLREVEKQLKDLPKHGGKTISDMSPQRRDALDLQVETPNWQPTCMKEDQFQDIKFHLIQKQEDPFLL